MVSTHSIRLERLKDCFGIVRKTMGSGPFGRVCGGLPLKRKYANRMRREKSIRFIGDAMEALLDKMSFGRRIWQRKKAHAWVTEVSAKDGSSPSSEPGSTLGKKPCVLTIRHGCRKRLLSDSVSVI